MCTGCFYSAPLCAQTALEGYVYEENNRGLLQQVQVTVFEMPQNILRAELVTDTLGHFSALLAPGTYRLLLRKDVFFDRQDTVQLGREKIYRKLDMRRRPGYIFDATIAEARESPDQIVDAIQGATIEIYNRTRQRPELVLSRYPEAFFQQNFEQGNHYTMLIRKPGFLAKRIEVYVNVEGCILCIDGVRSLTPGVTDNLTSGNANGTLLANIELERVRLEKKIEIQNIYYDYDKWNIRPDAAERLDLAVQLMKDNPGLTVELGSHTDARGTDAYNRDLSQKRAESAVGYIVSEGVEAYRITAKGYGESQLANRCADGVNCSEEEHQKNRRTMLRITGITNDTAEYRHWQSLEQIVIEEGRTKKMKAAGKKVTSSSTSTSTSVSTTTTTTTSHGARPLPEANNSVPLPPIEPASETSDLKFVPQALPARFTGFTLEVARAERALVAERDTVLRQSRHILMQREKETRQYVYYVGQFKTRVEAQAFLDGEAQGRFPQAKVVEYKNGKIVRQ